MAATSGKTHRVPQLKFISGVAFTLMLAGIVANAVLLQNGHHPAPLLAQRQTAAPLGDPAPLRSPRRIALQTAPAQPPVETPVPTAASNGTGAAAGETATPPVRPVDVAEKASRPASAQLAALARPQDADPIGQWLGGSAKPAAGPAHGVAKTEPQAGVTLRPADQHEPATHANRPQTVVRHLQAAPVIDPVAGRAAARQPDPIGRLLAKGDPAGDRVKPKRLAALPHDAQNPDVLNVQRGLKKLGYDVKPDGRMDSATRLAINSFERQHRRPGASEAQTQTPHDFVRAPKPPPD